VPSVLRGRDGRCAAGNFVHNDDPFNTDAASWGATAPDRGRWTIDAPSWQARHVPSLARVCNRRDVRACARTKRLTPKVNGIPLKDSLAAVLYIFPRARWPCLRIRV